MFIILEVDHMMFKTLITSKSSAAMKSIRICPMERYDILLNDFVQRSYE